MLLTPTVTLLNQGAVWSPLRLPGLAAWYDASDSATVLTSVGPDVPATDGQTVRRWLSRHNPAVFWDQSTLANQPVFTNPVTGLTFNGSSQFMNGTGTMADVFRNREYGYIFAVAQDTNPTGGDLTHAAILFSTGASSTAIRASILGRVGGVNNFATGGRRLDADTFTSSGIANSGAVVLLDGFFNWASGNHRIAVNGSAAIETAFPSAAGNSSNTASLGVLLGGSGTIAFPGNIRELVIVNEPLTATEILRTRQYLQRKHGTPALP